MVNPLYNNVDNKSFAKFLFVLALITLIGMKLFNCEEAGAHPFTGNPTPNCEVTILNPDGVQVEALHHISVPGDAVIPTSPIQPGENITVILGDQCPEIGMTLYAHPDNTPVTAHPGSVVVATAIDFTLPNGVSGIILTVPDGFDPCAYQLDLYRGGQIDSFGPNGPFYGPRLIDALNWYSGDDDRCTPGNTTTTTGSTTSTTESSIPTTTTEPENTTTIPEEVTTTIPEETTTTIGQSTTSTVIDTTSSSMVTSSTSGDPATTLTNVCVDDPTLNNVGRDSNGRFCSVNDTRPTPAEGVTSLPHTGTSTATLVWIGLALAVAGGLIVAATARRKDWI